MSAGRLFHKVDAATVICRVSYRAIEYLTDIGTKYNLQDQSIDQSVIFVVA